MFIDYSRIVYKNHLKNYGKIRKEQEESLSGTLSRDKRGPVVGSGNR